SHHELNCPLHEQRPRPELLGARPPLLFGHQLSSDGVNDSETNRANRDSTSSLAAVTSGSHPSSCQRMRHSSANPSTPDPFTNPCRASTSSALAVGSPTEARIQPSRISNLYTALSKS